VANDNAFSVEDFLNAITTQLDRVQDALRLKAVNRPLTYALKDLQLELKVFVDLDSTGTVRFRPAGPNEAGASSVQLAFTTITRPMIEENTISLASTRSAPLAELGLSGEEQQRLERVGVRNLAQLNELNATAGAKTISRLSDVSLDRLRTALSSGQPEIRVVKPPPLPVEPPRQTMPPGGTPPPSRPPRGPFGLPGRPVPAVDVRPGGVRPQAPERPILRVGPDARRLAIISSDIDSAAQPEVRLNDEPLTIAASAGDEIQVELPQSHAGGTLEVSLADGRVYSYGLAVDHDEDMRTADSDRWAPIGDHA
jgi:hypothetical protein